MLPGSGREECKGKTTTTSPSPRVPHQTCHQTAVEPLLTSLPKHPASRKVKPTVSASRFGLIQHHSRSRGGTKHTTRKSEELCSAFLAKADSETCQILPGQLLLQPQSRHRRAQRDFCHHRPRELAVSLSTGSSWFVWVAWCVPAHPECTGLGGPGRRAARIGSTGAPASRRLPRCSQPLQRPQISIMQLSGWPQHCRNNDAPSLVSIAPPPLPQHKQPCPLWGTPALTLACLGCSHGGRSCCLVAVQRHHRLITCCSILLLPCACRWEWPAPL